MKTGEILSNNGYLRQVLSINGNNVEVKTVGVPAYKSPGRPPKSGIVKVSSVKKWIKKRKNNRRKIQLII